MKNILIGEKHLSIDEIVDIAKKKANAEISTDKAFLDKIESSRQLLMNALDKGIPVYGVTTGYGKSCDKRMTVENALINGSNLLRFHGCGTGKPIGIEEIRAAMVTRISCFARGFSGVSLELIERLAEFLKHDITPVVPEEGSVGASGDLTPMSYIASTLIGERDVFYKGTKMTACEAIEKACIKQYEFKPKEPLALINGTSIMTGIAVLAIDRAKKILSAAVKATALSIHALMGNSHHFHPAISKAKPYPGQKYISDKIEQLIFTSSDVTKLEADTIDTLQDPYSLRCSPQILGVLYDFLKCIIEWVEIEANSANDNPLFDLESGDVLMGGNFYGGHISFAMDGLKSVLASAADMCDRQIVLLLDPHSNRGLPADLVIVKDEHKFYNHGFKAMSITSSALTAEALKLSVPAASFSRSTESHNQDKVSMGTIAARDASRVCELVERVVAIHLIIAVQACEIRGNYHLRPNIKRIIDELRKIVEPTIEDRPMDYEIEKVVSFIRNSDFFTL